MNVALPVAIIVFALAITAVWVRARYTSRTALQRPVVVERCNALHPSKVPIGWEYGQRHYVGERGATENRGEAITVYVQCEREAGHEGKHVASGLWQEWVLP